MCQAGAAATKHQVLLSRALIAVPGQVTSSDIGIMSLCRKRRVN